MSAPLQVAVAVVLAILAALAVLLPAARGRAWATLAALVLTPVALLAEIWATPQLEAVRARPGLALAGAVVGLLGLGALAAVLARRPALLALLAMAALPFRVPIESGGTTANLLLPLYAVIGAGALAWLVPRLRPGATHPERPPRALEKLLVGVVVLYALQSAWSGDAGKALEQVVFFYVPFALLFALLRELEWTPRLVRGAFGVLLGLALLFAAVGFWEFGTRELLLNPKVIASNQVEPYFRVNSLFFDPNIFGRFLALVMIGLAAVLLWEAERRLAALAAAAVAVLWGGLVLTLSQSSFAALLAGLAVLAALRFRPRLVAGVALAAVLAGAVAVLAFPGALRVELGDAESLDAATSGRAALLAGGVALAAERPLLGWGSGSFAREYRRREDASGPRAVAASHTIPVTVAAEQGVVGLLAYLALLAAALGRLGRGARGRPARAAILAAFVALVAHTWLYAAFLEDPMAWALLGVGVALARERPRRAAPPVAPPARRAPAAVPAATR